MLHLPCLADGNEDLTADLDLSADAGGGLSGAADNQTKDNGSNSSSEFIPKPPGGRVVRIVSRQSKV